MDDEDRAMARAHAVPEGFVTTYRDLWPHAPRSAGAVMARRGGELAWWRVVRSDGSLARGERQRERLDAEGVAFRGARVDLPEARLDTEALDGIAAASRGST